MDPLVPPNGNIPQDNGNTATEVSSFVTNSLAPAIPLEWLNNATAPDAAETDMTPPTDANANIPSQANPIPQEQADLDLAALLQAQEDQGYEDSGRDQDQPPEQFECVCGEAYTNRDDKIFLNCGCVRCISCVNANIRVGLQSRRDFPPRCCIPITVDDVTHYLEPDILARWLEVKDEYTDSAPVYCAVKTCSAYLPKSTFQNSENGAQWTLCHACDLKTCSDCMHLASEHQDNVCPQRLDKMNQDLMTENHWKTCPKCKSMIEKSDGCNHMRCDCGHEFCYQCGRSYEGGLPCNCHGENQWVEENPEDGDLNVQRELIAQFLGNRELNEDQQDDEDDDEGDSSEEDDDEDEDDDDDDDNSENSDDEHEDEEDR